MSLVSPRAALEDQLVSGIPLDLTSHRMPVAAELDPDLVARQEFEVMMAALPPVIGSDHNQPREPNINRCHTRKNKSAIRVSFGRRGVRNQIPVVERG